MDKFTNPTIYRYEHVEVNGIMRTGLYFQDIHGRDWYETLRNWKGAISLDDDRIVIAYEADVSFMGMQEGRDVYEVDPADVPANVLGNYKFSDGVFIDIRPGATEIAEQKKNELMEEADRSIAPLQDAVDIGEATDAEIALLQAWKKYRVLLNRVDTSNAPDIDWPPVPDDN
ncbi:tail fiber assembly protein [Enterobacter cancerogenus]|uniref:Tail fiber assembly protein n=1 Tax=Enterobacter cancerogenus TaxID=69218 RepID=A0ABX8KHX8_9ENTR|nr:tail fiber assembly protein [Enterobacter cancerogenus]QXA48684.1 tail fiber assembly protein [Enterobacter cancerogenus]